MKKLILFFIIALFLMWAAGFIYNSSFVGIDKKQYFSLSDDAMISMRYAWNLANGFGLVWNDGERVQGYSNLLMTLVMTIANFVLEKRFAVLSIQIFGGILMVAVANTAMKIGAILIKTTSEKHQIFIEIIIFSSVLSYYPLNYWSLMGMETGILTLLIMQSILISLKFMKSKKITDLYVLAVYLGFAFLTRNDSIIFAVIIWIFILSDKNYNRTKIKIILNFLLASLLFFIFVTGQLVFQHIYYGEILPNTYTLKLSGMPLLIRVKNGIGFIKLFLTENIILLFFASLSQILKFQKPKFLLFMSILASISYQIYIGGDVWNYWRLLSPTIPLVIILVVSVLVDLDTWIEISFSNRNSLRTNNLLKEKHRTEKLIALIMLVGIFTANLRFLPEIFFQQKPFETNNNKFNVNIALVLSEITTEEATIGETWAGALPYYSGRRAIDFLGKNDKYISNLSPDLSGSISWNGMNSVPGHNKYDLNYSIITLRPTFLRVFKWGNQDITTWALENYVLVQYRGLKFYLLRNSPDVYWGKIYNQK